jgi:hypothetical protein
MPGYALAPMRGAVIHPVRFFDIYKRAFNNDDALHVGGKSAGVPHQRGADDGLDRPSAKPFFNQHLGALVYALSPLRLLKRDNFTVGASKRWKPATGEGESQGRSRTSL